MPILSGQSLVTNLQVMKVTNLPGEVIDPRARTFAQVLVLLSSFNFEIEDARELIPQFSLQEFPVYEKVEDYEVFVRSLLKDHFEEVHDRVNFIRFLFRLSEAWSIPLHLAILTGVLAVPKEIEPVKIITIGEKSERKTALVFNLRCKKERIVEWVRQHYAEIDLSLIENNTPWERELNNNPSNMELGFKRWLVLHADLIEEDLKMLQSQIESDLNEKDAIYTHVHKQLFRLLQAVKSIDFLNSSNS